MCRSGPVAVVTASRNDITCGFSTRFAIVRPAVVYGMHDAVGAGEQQLPLGVVVEARATIWMSGRTARAESEM